MTVQEAIDALTATANHMKACENAQLGAAAEADAALAKARGLEDEVKAAKIQLKADTDALAKLLA